MENFDQNHLRLSELTIKDILFLTSNNQRSHSRNSIFDNFPEYQNEAYTSD